MTIFSGYNQLKENDVKFDWKKFWEYLKPHLIKFIGAILVRNRFTFINS